MTRAHLCARGHSLAPWRFTLDTTVRSRNQDHEDDQAHPCSNEFIRSVFNARHFRAQRINSLLQRERQFLLIFLVS
jgi:hypothetical protein